MKRRGTCNRYRVKGKQLASLSGDPEGRPIFAVKLEPAFSVFLRERYPATVPGYQHFFYAWPQYLVEDLLRDMATPNRPQGCWKIIENVPDTVRRLSPSNFLSAIFMI